MDYYKSDGSAFSFSSAVQVEDIGTTGDTSNSLNQKYFTINSPSAGYYVWFNTSGTPGSGNPSVSGKTGVEVAIQTGETAGFVAKKVVDALNNVSGTPFTSSTTTGVAEVTSITAKGNGVQTVPGGPIVSLKDKYFRIEGIDASGVKTSYVVWFKEETVGSAPSVNGTKIAVDLSSATLSATDVATAVQSE